MGWRLMFHLYRDRDEPPACLIGNRGAYDLAVETQFLGHVDLAEFRNMEHVSINRELIIVEVEGESIPFLAFEMRKTCFLPILTRMFEFGLCAFFFHAPVVGEGLS